VLVARQTAGRILPIRLNTHRSFKSGSDQAGAPDGDRETRHQHQEKAYPPAPSPEASLS